MRDTVVGMKKSLQDFSRELIFLGDSMRIGNKDIDMKSSLHPELKKQSMNGQ
jgi:hypothetical protein